jgi:hypothetical protein
LFPSLILDGQLTPNWDYVRMTSSYDSNAPVTDVSSPAIRCNQLDPAGTANDTATVHAGDTVGFSSVPNAYHPGPMSFYMARAPNGTIAADFQGDGQVWFKIWEDQPNITPASIRWPNTGKCQPCRRVSYYHSSSERQLTQAPTGKSRYTVVIPKCLPSGDYLLRIEQVGLHTAEEAGGAQFYISCAQLRVVEGGSGTPSPLVSLPGAFKANDPGIKINIYYPVPQTYQVPGPKVWAC